MVLPGGPVGALAAHEARVSALLPPQYQRCLDSVSPTSMGSAALKYDQDARVAWDEIWTHFCDLALAGGPPHRGSLLEAPTADEVAAEPAGYQLVYEEILRGVRMTTGLVGAPAPDPGWVTVPCHGDDMAAWLLRAVMAENIFVRKAGAALLLPAGPWFRVAKEVKNVVVALAKTCHYWSDHLSATQRAAAAAAMGDPLQPSSRPEVLARAAEYAAAADAVARDLRAAIDLPTVAGPALGWVGVRLADEETAAWHVRAAIAEDVLARREGEWAYLPVPAPGDGVGPFQVVERVAHVHRLWQCRPGSCRSGGSPDV